jgi:hypothetical protein
MIHEVDEALHGLLTGTILASTGTEVAFDAPTRDWAARRSAPTVNLFLYDIREDLTKRQIGRIEQDDETGRTQTISGPPRWYRLSYLVTAWTKRPQDEHRLLSTLLAGLVAEPTLAPERLVGSLAALGQSVRVDIALPPIETRALADVWSALGGELKPSLDLVITAPLADRGRAAAPPVTDPMELRVTDNTPDDPEAAQRTETRHGRPGEAVGTTGAAPGAGGARRIRGPGADRLADGSARR